MSPLVIPTTSNLPLMGDMGVGCEVKGDTGVDWCGTWVLSKRIALSCVIRLVRLGENHKLLAL